AGGSVREAKSTIRAGTPTRSRTWAYYLRSCRTRPAETTAAEVVEGRPVTKENIMKSNTRLTQSGKRVSQGLRGVRERARSNKEERFTALLHHVTIDKLRESFHALKRKAAPGVDGVRWKEYATGLEDRLKDLHSRVHRGAYQAQPSRRQWIPK